jgi:hypothetical protein
MNMIQRLPVVLTATISCALLVWSSNPTKTYAHGIAGNRVFPVTLAIDDPAVADELSLPTFAYFPINGDGVRETDLSFEYAKTITKNFGISIADTWTRLHPGGSGFQNLETTLKYQLFVDGPHEFMFSAGLSSEWGKTGAATVGAEGFTTLTPQIYFGKGLGDLPTSLDLLRPFAMTGQFGLALPTRSRSVTTIVDPTDGSVDIEIDKHATFLRWGLTLQYSLPYMNANIRQVEGPDVLKRLIPLVEASFLTPVSNIPDGAHRTIGTINPGIIYLDRTFQIGLEAMIPINGASGKHVGVLAQLHFFFDDLFPNSLGKPLFQ